MTQLNVPSIELVSTLRAAPFNGNASSQDYNDSWTESLADLASLAGFINDVLIPMLNGLSLAIQPALTATPSGLEGRFIFSDTTDTSQVFFDQLASTPNTVADSLRVLEGIIGAVQTTIGNLTVEITALQAAQASTNQNDVAQALQNFATSLSSLTAQVDANSAALAAVSILFKTNSVANGTQNILNLIAGSGISIVDGIAGAVTITNTSVSPSLETDSTPNSTQALLNLHGGTDISLIEAGGTVTIAYTGAAGGLTLQTEAVPNSTQALLNLHGGSGISVGESLGTVTITNATVITLKTESTANSTQTLLNLHAGAGISVGESGGTVTIANTDVLVLETESTPNSTQTLLNLHGGTGISVGESSGTVTVTNTYTLPSAAAAVLGGIELNTDLGGTATVPHVVATHLSSPLPMSQGGSGGTTLPFDVPVFAPGVGINNQKLLRIKLARHVTFPASASNSYATASAASTGSPVFSLTKNGVQFGTITFSASVTGVFAQGSDATFVPGDLLEVDGPATADTTLANVGITLYGSRTS